MANKFGFGALQPRSITVHLPLDSLYQKMVNAEPSLRLCINCGMCSSVCTANRFEETQFHKMVILLRYGLQEEAFTYARRCVLCGNCILTCPRNVNIRHVMFLLKKEIHEHSL